MKSIASIFFGMMVLLVVFYGFGTVGEEVYTNDNIDENSKTLINNFTGSLDSDFNTDEDFNELQSNLSVNGTFDSEDVFAQEYLEGKSQSTSKTGIIKKLIKIPDLIILGLGAQEDDVFWIKGLILLIISVVLGFAAYRAIFGGGRITDN